MTKLFLLCKSNLATVRGHVKPLVSLAGASKTYQPRSDTPQLGEDNRISLSDNSVKTDIIGMLIRL